MTPFVIKASAYTRAVRFKGTGFYCYWLSLYWKAFHKWAMIDNGKSKRLSRAQQLEMGALKALPSSLYFLCFHFLFDNSGDCYIVKLWKINKICIKRLEEKLTNQQMGVIISINAVDFIFFFKSKAFIYRGITINTNLKGNLVHKL